jgi:hypothetical protein
MGYEEETDTKFTVAGDRLYLRKWFKDSE